MNAVIKNLKSHYADGLVIDDSLSSDEIIVILQDKKPGGLVKITWTVDGRSYSAQAGNLEEKDIPYFKPSMPVKLALVNRLLGCVQPPTLKRFVSFHLLPDSSGFLRFESGWDRSDNCLLLNAYGKERMRLTVPWEMTGSKHAESALAPTSFANISGPYVNPADGKEGQYGVTAWVERAGMFYFELDYHTGQFLWCKQIRD